MDTTSNQSSPALPDTPPESVAGEPPNFPPNSQHPQLLTCNVHTEAQDNAQNSTLADSSPVPFLSPPSGSSSPTRDFPSAAVRQLTREILELTMPQSSRNADDGVSTLDPTKYDPSCTMEVPIMYNNHSSQSSATDSSGSSIRHPTMWKTLPDAPNAPVPLSNSAEPSRQARSLPQSKSEGNVRSLHDGVHEHTPLSNNLYGNWGEGSGHYAVESSQHENTDDVFDGQQRGRHRSRSPVKVLEDLDENSALEFITGSPPRRSRSPHKKLFGENGWLGRSPDIKDFQADKNKIPGLKGLGVKLKQRVEDITGDVMKSHSATPEHSKQHQQHPSKPGVPISLDPPTQAKLYSELELMICATANKFLVDQHRQGRMNPDSLAKVTNFWTSKNRPQVVQFQYDQATQRDLILYNLRTFAFHGQCARNPVLLNAIMYDWKAVAKEMSVRTFCYPDGVVRKHMHDTHKILEMLGAPLVTFLAFQELQVNALALMKSEDEKKLSTSAASRGPGRGGNPSGGHWSSGTHEQDHSRKGS